MFKFWQSSSGTAWAGHKFAFVGASEHENTSGEKILLIIGFLPGYSGV